LKVCWKDRQSQQQEYNRQIKVTTFSETSENCQQDDITGTEFLSAVKKFYDIIIIFQDFL